MTYRLARSLEVLRDEVNAAAPERSTASDGWIGDAAHASRTSDHNPWVKIGSLGIVTAIDVTDDPPDHSADDFAEWLRTQRDPRVKYVIDQHRMFSSYATSTHAAWVWRPYSGVNAHKQHTHISVHPHRNLYDSTAPWGWQEDDMSTADEIAKAVWSHKFPRDMDTELALNRVERRSERMDDVLKGLVGMVRSLGKGDVADIDAVADALLDRLAERLKD